MLGCTLSPYYYIGLLEVCHRTCCHIAVNMKRSEMYQDKLSIFLRSMDTEQTKRTREHGQHWCGRARISFFQFHVQFPPEWIPSKINFHFCRSLQKSRNRKKNSNADVFLKYPRSFQNSMRPRSSGENIFVFSRTFGLLGTSAELLQK